MTWRRGLAIAVLPLALLACTDDGDEPSADDEPAAEETTTGSAPESDLPDICTLVETARVEEIMAGAVAETVPHTDEGGSRSCSWTIDGTSHALTVVVFPKERRGQVTLPTLEGVSGGFQAQAESDVEQDLIAESFSTFTSDPGKDMTPILQALNDEVLAAIA